MNHSPIKWFAKRFVTKTFAKVPLQILLIVPFVLQTVGVVTLVGYLSYHSCQEAVEKLADQLITEVGDRVEQHLDNYLGKAQEINRTNLDAFESGILDFNDFNALGKYFYRQARFFNFTYVNFGSKEGGFIGAGYGLGNKLEIGEIPISDRSYSRSYSVDDQGNRLKLAATLKNPQYNNAGWYWDAVKAGKPVWSSIYTWANVPDRICISASTPVYDQQKKLLGVLGIDLELNQISQFLKKLHGSRSGHIFIIERSGLIVASSEDESPAPIINGQATRLKALNSREPGIREVTADLTQRFGSLQAIFQPQSFRPALEQKPFVKVIPYRDDYGLDWLVVTVIPESEFMAEIDAGNQRTFLLCVLALVIAIATGSLTAQWIAQPIWRLSQASQSMAQGEWQQPLSEDIKIAEFKVLTTSFNQMSAQVQESFERVKIALQESKEKYQTLFKTLSIGVSITDAEGKIIESNPSAERILGIPAQSQTERSVDAPDWLMIRPDGSPMPVDEFASVRALKENRFIHDVEMGIVHPDGEIKWIRVSAAPIPLEQYGVAIAYVDITDVYNELRLRKQAESALQESEAKFRRLTENVPGMIYQYVLHPDGSYEFTYVSPRCRNIYEIEPESVTANAKVLWDMVHPDYVHKLMESVAYSAQELRPFFSEHQVITPNQELKWVQASARPEKQANGDIVWDGMTIDITKRKQAEQALADTQRFIEQITELTPNLLYIYDLIEQRNVYINRSVAEILGYSAAQVQAMGANLFPTICHPNDLNRVYEAIQKCYLLQDHEILEIEYRVRDAKGEWRWLYSRDQVFSRTADGKVKQTLGTSQDITDRKQVELALRKSEKRLQKISASSPGVIFIIVKRVDDSLYYEYISHAFEEIHEITVEEVLENPQLCFQQFHPDDYPGYMKAAVQSLETMCPFNYEWRIITPSGKLKWIKARSRPERRENGEIAFYGVVLDVSDRKQVELALQEAEANLRLANQELEKLVNIDGLTQIANRRCFDNRLEQEWQRLYRENQHLSLLLFDVDYFKRYNDYYGHQLGDECLLKIAQAVQKVVCRPADLVARYGGEEFVVILPDTDIEGAIAVAQNIHTAIKDLAIPHQASGVSDIVTISLGIATIIPASELSIATLIDQADQALYRAKQQGRNQSVIFSFEDG